MDHAPILICYDFQNPHGQRFALRPDFSVRPPRSCSTWRPCSHLRSVTP